MANLVYDSFFEDLMDGALDLNTDTIKVALLQGASGGTPYTPNSAHAVFDDVDGSEISGTGYTAGGETLANPAITDAKFDADDVVWSGATFTTAYAVVYKDSGDPATSPLICLLDLGGEKSVTAGTFTLEFHSNGIMTFEQIS